MRLDCVCSNYSHCKLLGVVMIATLFPALLNAAEVAPQDVFAAYWTGASGYQSIAQLHNNLIDDPLIVHPAIYSARGERFNLPAVTVGPSGNVSFDLGAAAPESVRSGSAVFEYSYQHTGALSVEIAITNRAATFAYTVIGTEYGASPGDQSAVFWLPSGKSEAYVAVQNISAERIRVSAAIDIGGVARPFSTVNLAPHESTVIQAPVGRAKTSENEDRFGAIILSHDGPAGSLNTSGWIEDDDTGFSTMMTFYDPQKHTGNKLFGTQVLMGPQKGFLTSGTPLNVSSYVVLLNTSATTNIRAQGMIAFQNGGKPARVPIDFGLLGPNAVAEVDIADLQNRGVVPAGVSSAALTVSYDGPEGFLMGRVFGIGSNATFGFYTTLETNTVASITCVYWTTVGDATPVLTISNFGERPDQITTVITYNGGTVTLPKFSLDPLESTTINLRSLREKGIVPADADFGGIRVYGSSLANSKLLVKDFVITESGGTATPFYGSMVYAYRAYLTPSSLDIVYGGTDQVHVVVCMSDNSQNFDLSPSITSENTSIITVGSTFGPSGRQ